MTDTLKLAWRKLWDSPLFTLFAVLILALGIGATTTTFSLVNAVAFRPLPYPHPERLVFVWGATGGAERQRKSVSFPNFEDWRREARSFERLVAFSQPSYTLTRGDGVERIDGELVSADYFRMVGIEPSFGRGFVAPEDRGLGEHPVAVISDGLWRRAFGADRGVLGRPVKINGGEYTVVGVMPRGFRGITGQADVWVPMTMMREAIPELGEVDALNRRDVSWFAVLGRLKPGVTPAQADAEMRGIAARLARAYPEADKDLSAMVVPLADQLLGEVRPVAVLLLGAVVFVLLIACANLASLLLIRGVARQQEVAIRAALGASRGQVVRQFLAESLLLALLGGAVGVLLAVGGLKVLAPSLAESLPGFLSITIDWRVMAFAALMAVATGIAFGLLPALESSKPRLHLCTRAEGGGAGGRARSRSRFLLLTGEIAAALALLAGAGLFLKAIQQIGRLDMGYQVADRLTLRVDLPTGEYSAGQLVAFARELEQRLSGLPGVESAALSSDLPLGDRQLVSRVFLQQPHDGKPELEVKVSQHAVTPGFFRTMGIPLAAGRNFGSQDGENGARAVILSKGMASRYWPGRDPLGQRVRLSSLQSSENWVTVVGVAADARFHTLAQNPSQDFDLYVPLDQAPSPSLGLIVKTAPGATGVVAEVRREVQGLHPNLAVYEVATLEERVAHEAAGSRVGAAVTTLCALLALGLAMFGLYGSLAYSASQRSREMGIRLALGAQRSDLVRLGLAEGLRVALAGVVVGLALAYLIAGALRSVLFGVDPADPLLLLGVAALVIAASVLASLLSARYVLRLSPIEAIRES